MKLVCYIKEGQEQLAMLTGDMLYDMDALHPELPSSMSMFLNYWNDYYPLAKTINESIEQGKFSLTKGIPQEAVTFISPVPLPSSCRTAIVNSENFSTTKLPPSFYFINHHNVQGPGDISIMPDHFKKLDLELGIAIVVSSYCRNITAAEADQYIGGYMIINKIITEDQFSNINVTNVIGPWLVTPDELESPVVETGEEDQDRSFSLKMKCSLNGEVLSEFNFADINQAFAEIVESCAYGTALQPGDVIGVGPVNMGYYRNQNQKGNQLDPDYLERWLQNGDVVEIEVEGLGTLKSTITAEDSDFSLNH